MKGATPHTTGSSVVGDPDVGVYAHPTVVEGVRAGDALYSTETFGPLVGLGSFGSLDEGVVRGGPDVVPGVAGNFRDGGAHARGGRPVAEVAG